MPQYHHSGWIIHKPFVNVMASFLKLNLCTEIVRKADPAQVDLLYVLHVMSSEDVENLPPGGQLCAKSVRIDQFDFTFRLHSRQFAIIIHLRTCYLDQSVYLVSVQEVC